MGEASAGEAERQVGAAVAGGGGGQLLSSRGLLVVQDEVGMLAGDRAGGEGGTMEGALGGGSGGLARGISVVGGALVKQLLAVFPAEHQDRPGGAGQVRAAGPSGLRHQQLLELNPRRAHQPSRSLQVVVQLL